MQSIRWGIIFYSRLISNDLIRSPAISVTDTLAKMREPLGQKKKLLYWRNPTDPKIRPDPTFFFKKPKKKKDKNRPTDPKKSKTCDFFFWLVA